MGAFLFIRKIFEKLKNPKKVSVSGYSAGSSKTRLADGVNLTINSEHKKLIEQVRINVDELVNKTNCVPEELINYIKAANTQVYIIPNADKILALLHEDEGFICEQRGVGALCLSIATGGGIRFRTAPMFILNDCEIDKYLLLHAFYKWYSYKSNLPGFDYVSQQKLKKYIQNNSLEVTRKLNLTDISQIQEAIARDQEATAFVLDYGKKIDGTKNVLNKIKTDGGANI